MGACRATAGSKNADLEKYKAKRKKTLSAKENVQRSAELARWGPVTDAELAKAEGAARKWLVVVKFMQTLEASFRFQMAVTSVILLAAVLIGLMTLPPSALVPNVLLVFEWSINGVFILEVIVKMIAKKWRPLKFFTAEEYEWAWNNFDFWVVVLSVLGGLDIIPGLGNQVQLFRLLRLLRVLKLLKMIVELQMILRGLAAGISSVLYVAMLMLLIFYLYGCIGFILYRDEDPAHFDTILEAFVITLFRACTLEDWTDLFYTSYYGCESYGYEKPTRDKLCARYFTGTNTVYLSAIEPCNQTYAFQCYDPFHQTAFNSTIAMAVGVSSGAELSGQPYHNGRILFQVIVFIYWVVFIFIGSFVLLSLFIGAITIGMQSSLDEAKEEKQALERNRKLADRAALHKALAESQCKEIKRLWNGLERVKFDPSDLPPWQRHPAMQAYIQAARKVKLFSESGAFNNTITAIIVLASVMVGLGEDDIVWAGFNGCSQVPCPKGETRITDTIEFTILMIFAAECSVKILAEGVYPYRYLVSQHGAVERWNLFDFVIVVLGIVGETGVFGEQGSILMVLRLLRLLRVLKLVRALPELQVIVSALISGLGSIGYVSILLVLIYYIYAILGCIAFASNDPWHFRDVINAMLTLFRASTFEDWTDIMYINMYGCDKHFFYAKGTPSLMCNNKELGFVASAQPYLAALYFLSFILLAALVMMSLFIGVVTTSMEAEKSKQSTGKIEDREIAEIRQRCDIDDDRYEEYKQIFAQICLPTATTIDSKDLGFLLDAVSDGDMPQLVREERKDEVLGDKENAELTFCQVLRVLTKLEVDSKQKKEAEERAKKLKFATNPKQRRLSEASQRHLMGDGAERSTIDEQGRLVIDTPLKRGVPTKVRRLLAHSEGFEIPDTVGLNSRGIAMLVSSVVTMRLHAEEAEANREAEVPEADNKALRGFGFSFAPKSTASTPAPVPTTSNSGAAQVVDVVPTPPGASRSLPPPGVAVCAHATQANECTSVATMHEPGDTSDNVVAKLAIARQPGASSESGEGEMTTEYMLRLLREVESVIEGSLIFEHRGPSAGAEANMRGTRAVSPTLEIAKRAISVKAARQLVSAVATRVRTPTRSRRRRGATEVSPSDSKQPNESVTHTGDSNALSC